MLIIIDNFVQFFVVFPPHPLIQLVCLLLIAAHSCMQSYSAPPHIHSDCSAWKIQTNHKNTNSHKFRSPTGRMSNSRFSVSSCWGEIILPPGVSDLEDFAFLQIFFCIHKQSRKFSVKLKTCSLHFSYFINERLTIFWNTSIYQVNISWGLLGYIKSPSWSHCLSVLGPPPQGPLAPAPDILIIIIITIIVIVITITIIIPWPGDTVLGRSAVPTSMLRLFDRAS